MGNKDNSKESELKTLVTFKALLASYIVVTCHLLGIYGHFISDQRINAFQVEMTSVEAFIEFLLGEIGPF